MFAVIKTGGKQYRVAANDVLKIEKVAGEVGDFVEIGQVLAHGEGDNVVVDAKGGEIVFEKRKESVTVH